MGLSGLEIYKHLPKSNCKECGLPTCLAFAMKVAAKQASVDDCPRITEEAKNALGAASAPPQKLVTLGAGEHAIEVGQETVLFRHEETFHHATGIAPRLSDKLSADELKTRCEGIKEMSWERMGDIIAVDMVAIANDSGDASTFKSAVETVAGALPFPAVLMSSDVDALKGALGAYADRKPVLCGATGETLEAMSGLAKDADAVLCLTGKDPDEVAGLTEAASKAGVKDILISPGEVPLKNALGFLTATRRAALKKTFRALGYPVLAMTPSDEAHQTVVDACTFVCKYAAVVVAPITEPWQALAILTTRQNLYTDPRKPVQVEAKMYEVNNPDKVAPVMITTNFSLSYYSVHTEVEASRVPSRIIAVDTEGTSVLTAWAADKFNAETITEAVKTAGVEEMVGHKKLVIPGHVAVLSAGIQDESGWEVVVGPKEASGIGPFLKNQWKP